MQFSFIINNTNLKIAETKLPYTGNVNSYRCVFDITSDIDNLSWFCVFGTNGSYYIQQIMGNACYIPAEVLMSENTIQIGCYATNMAENDYKRISTNWVYLKALEGAYTEGSLPEIPSPDVWETLVSKAIPTIGANGNWYIYDMSLGEYVDTGVKASGGGSGDLSDYYTSEAVDTLLAQKANKSDVEVLNDKLAEKTTLTEEQIANINNIPFIESEVSLAKDEVGQLTTDFEALYDMAYEVKYDMELKQDIVDVRYATDEPEYVYNFGYTHNTDTRLDEAYTTSISFAFNNNVYVDDYISSLSFDSGETPTRIDYINSGILNWVGTDCSDNNGYSIFKPEANKHYDIVFYFNGRQFIGLVNGFVPSLGNVVS